MRVKREELGWKPCLNDFKAISTSIRDAKGIEESWKMPKIREWVPL